MAAQAEKPTMGKLEAMTADQASKTASKRKSAPKDDEDEDSGSGSDGDSDVVSPACLA